MNDKLRDTFLMNVSDVLDYPGMDTVGLFTCNKVPEHSYNSVLSDLWGPGTQVGAEVPCVVCGSPVQPAATMRALLLHKRTANNYQGLLEDVRARGQLTPIHTIGAFVNNGGHRIAIAVDLGWDTILCTEIGTNSNDNSLTNSWRSR